MGAGPRARGSRRPQAEPRWARSSRSLGRGQTDRKPPKRQLTVKGGTEPRRGRGRRARAGAGAAGGGPCWAPGGGGQAEEAPRGQGTPSSFLGHPQGVFFRTCDPGTRSLVPLWSRLTATLGASVPEPSRTLGCDSELCGLGRALSAPPPPQLCGSFENQQEPRCTGQRSPEKQSRPGTHTHTVTAVSTEKAPGNSLPVPSRPPRPWVSRGQSRRPHRATVRPRLTASGQPSSRPGPGKTDTRLQGGGRGQPRRDVAHCTHPGLNPVRAPRTTSGHEITLQMWSPAASKPC